MPQVAPEEIAVSRSREKYGHSFVFEWPVLVGMSLFLLDFSEKLAGPRLLADRYGEAA